MYNFNLHKYFCLVLLITFCATKNINAQNKKKKYNKGKKSEVNILKRAYNDVTTRNNYYFNANILFNEMLKKQESAQTTDYSKLLPFYFHDWDADFSTHSADLETIVKKTSIVLQLHDNMRWKDDCYLLLAKARYLQKDYTQALGGFKYIVTTMKGDIAREESKYDHKARLKYLKEKQKEIDKKNKEKQKVIEFFKQQRDEEIKKKIEERKKEIAEIKKAREKEIAEKIKQKKKNLKRKKKGKKIKKDYRDIGKNEPTVKKKGTKEEEEEEEATEKKNSSLDKYKNIYFEKIREEEIDNDSVVVDTTKENLDDLTLWEKIKHKKARPEAIVWMAKTFMDVGNYADARSMITYGKALRKLTKKQRRDMYLIDAYYYVRQNSYRLAIPPLKEAIEYSKKKDKAYYGFILAQIYNELDIPNEAIEQYNEVLATKADYEIHLFAKLNQADIYSKNNLTSNEEVFKMLNKMLKNGQNKKYKHKIHFALANLHLNIGEIDQAKYHLSQTIEKSENDIDQKALAFLKLGELYYDEENYMLASAYYDSTVVTADKQKLDNFSRIEDKSASLKNLVKELNNITVQDSLLMLSAMTETELQEYLKEAEEKGPKKRKFKGLIEEGEREVFINNSNSSFSTLSNTSGLWYFYNKEIMSRGFNEFKSIWGNVKNEDNWRRSSYNAEITTEETIVIEDTTISNGANTEKEVLEIPKSKEDIKNANEIIAQAYYNTGTIFMHNLENRPKAINYFEKLISKYPDHELNDKARYALYLLHTEENNLIAANRHKDYLLNKDPHSMIAHAITTDYKVVREKTKRAKDEVEIMYASTYSLFEDGEYLKVLENNKSALEKYGENYFTPKFKFLEALSFGHLKKTIELKNSLSEIIRKYPDHEIKDKAVEYLAIINKSEIQEKDKTNKEVSSQEEKGKDKPKEEESIYKMDTKPGLFALVYIRDNSLPIQEFVKNINDYHAQKYTDRKLKVSNAFLSIKEPLLIIKRFRDKADGIAYFNTLQEEKADIFGKYNLEDIELFIISQNNFRTLFQTKDVNAYRQFFIKNYLLK